MVDYVDGHGDVHTKIETSDIANWEKEYPTMNGVKLSKREKEILDGDELKSHEGMVFGRMYSDWKRRKGYE